MKKLAFILLVTMAFLGTACTKADAKDNLAKTAQNQQQWEVEEFGVSVDYSEIAPEIMMFVETHFPQTGIYNCQMTQHYYKVKLNDCTKLKFTHAFDWIEVDCEHSTVYTFVPASIVPEQIKAYVTANFPNQTIEEIEKKTNGNWEIELNNNHEIKFDADFNVISGGNNGGGGNGGGTSTNYPEITTFVETYFPQVGILNAHQDGNEIDVKLTDMTEIDFYLTFEWKKIDCDDSQVYGMVPTELVPAQITDYVNANFPNNHIDQIEKKTNGNWEIELNNDHEIKFDANFNVISGGNGGGGNGGGTSTNYPEITTFVETYFSQVGIRKVEHEGNKYEVELTDNTEIEFNLSFEWKSIDCEESQVYGMVPNNLVPAQITDYVNANYPGKHIDKIEKKHNGGWEIELSNGLEITFDSNFNVTGIDDKK